MWPTPLVRTTPPMGLVDFLIIAGLVFVNGFFVAAEFALVKVRTSQIDQLVEEGNWAAKLTSRALDHLDAYLSASQVGITVASLALGWAIENRAAWEASWHLLELTGLEGSRFAGIAVIAFVPGRRVHVRHVPAHGAGSRPPRAWPSARRRSSHSGRPPR